MNTLLAWPISWRTPSTSTASNGEPVATMARPSVQRRTSAGVASADRGRVGQRQDDRPLGRRRHRPDDGLVERAGHPGRADEDGRPDPLDRLDEARDSSVVEAVAARRPRPAARARASWRRGPRAGRGRARASRPARAPGGRRPRPCPSRASPAGAAARSRSRPRPAPTSTTRASASAVPSAAQAGQDPRRRRPRPCPGCRR